jgi:hypothetical protein
MSADELFKVFSCLGLGLLMAAVVLAIARRYRTAVVVNAAFPLLIFASFIPHLREWATNLASYVERHGPAEPVIAGLALLSVICSCVAFQGRAAWGVIAWAANGVVVGWVILLAFFFQIHF